MSSNSPIKETLLTIKVDDEIHQLKMPIKNLKTTRILRMFIVQVMPISLMKKNMVCVITEVVDEALLEKQRVVLLLEQLRNNF